MIIGTRRASLKNRLIWTLICFLSSIAHVSAGEGDYFSIHVVDDVTGRGVPLVELKTVNNIRYYTDSAGVVAFHEPGLMNRAVFFHVKSHGYEFPQDGFGYRGVRLKIEPGGTATLKIERINIAERLYRLTGAGIYRDTVLLGRSTPTKQPLLNGDVFGSDSVVNAVFNGKIYWFWGDTNRPSYPLGNFHVPGAVSELPAGGGLNPQLGVEFEYFVDEKGFAKSTAKMPGNGPTWIDGLVTLSDSNHGQQMFASFVKVKPPLTVYQRGLAEFNKETNQFQKLCEFDIQSPLFPRGHPLKHTEGGIEYVYFATPFPVVRVEASAGHLRDSTKYEAYTCLKTGSRSDSIQVEREGGVIQYRWRRNTIPFTPQLQAKLIREGLIKSGEGLFQLTDDAGKTVAMHGGSVYWNDYRRRWIMIGLQSFGSSLLGEIWYSEAEQLVGPWTHATKIVTHRKYSFYNPKQHPMLDQEGGRVIFFEGTYTSMFSGNEDQTPRYDYNQIMYKLDLSDPRLGLKATNKVDSDTR